MRRPIAEVVLCVGLSAAAAALALATPTLIDGYSAMEPYYNRSAFFPLIALVCIVIFGTLAAVQSLRGVTREQSGEVESGRSRIGVALAGALFFALSVGLTTLVGYWAAAFLTALALGHLVRLKLKLNLLLATGLAVLLQLVFVSGFKVWFAPSTAAKLLQ